MILLPLQYDTHRGPDAIGQHKLTFTMDESITNDFNPMQIKKGTQFLVALIEVNSGEHDDFAQETADETKERFWKQFHALITDIAKMRNITQDEYKDEIRSMLIKSGRIEKSTKELTLEDLAGLIVYLKKQKHETN